MPGIFTVRRTPNQTESDVIFSRRPCDQGKITKRIER